MIMTGRNRERDTRGMIVIKLLFIVSDTSCRDELTAKAAFSQCIYDLLTDRSHGRGYV